MSGDTVLSLIFKAGLVVKFVLLLLLFFSIVSWAIIIYKQKLFSKIAKETDLFNVAYNRSKDWESLYHSTKNLALSPWQTFSEPFIHWMGLTWTNFGAH